MTFKYSYMLRKHQKVHTDGIKHKTLKCDKCDKVFKKAN